MSRALPYFRTLSNAELRDSLRKFKAVVEKMPMPDDLREFSAGLLEHLLGQQQGAFAYVERMEQAVSLLPQSHQGKESLLADLADYLFVNPTIKESIKNRISRGLVVAQPQPEKKKAKAAIDVSGKTFEFAEGFEPWKEA